MGDPIADAFGYNDRSEVTSASIMGWSPSPSTASYGYDGIGNLLLSSFNAATNAYTANSLNQYTSILCDSVTLCEPTYDTDGNMLSDGVLSFTYDAASRLKTVSSNGVTLVTNFYDAKSRRVKKVTPNATTTFFYDDWNLVEERIAYADNTTSTIRYYWGKDLSGSFQGAGGVGGLLWLTIDGVVYIPCYDNNGNVTRYLNANGGTFARYSYDAFGKLIARAGRRASFFRHRFSTKYFDSETGLYYYGYRFYHPGLMRWLNRDPIEEDGGVNLLAFVGNRFGLYDVLGLKNEPCSRVGNFNILKIKLEINPAEREFSQNKVRDEANDLLGQLAGLGFSGSTAGLGTKGRILRLIYTGGDYLAKRRAALGGVGDLGESLEDFRAKYLKGIFRVDGRLKYQLCLCRKGKLRFIGQEDIVDKDDVDFSNAYDLTLYREEIIRVVKSMEKSLLEKLSRKVKEARK